MNKHLYLCHPLVLSSPISSVTYHYFAAQSPSALLQLSNRGTNLKFCCRTNTALVLVTMHKQLLPLPCAFSVSNVASCYSKRIFSVLHFVSPPVKRLTAAMAEFLNLCQDEVNAVMCSGILSKNNDNAAQHMNHFQCHNDNSFNRYTL